MFSLFFVNGENRSISAYQLNVHNNTFYLFIQFLIYFLTAGQFLGNIHYYRDKNCINNLFTTCLLLAQITLIAESSLNHITGLDLTKKDGADDWEKAAQNPDHIYI